MFLIYRADGHYFALLLWVVSEYLLGVGLDSFLYRFGNNDNNGSSFVLRCSRGRWCFKHIVQDFKKNAIDPLFVHWVNETISLLALPPKTAMYTVRT